MNKKLSPFLVLFAAMLWGTTGTAQTFAPEGASPIAIGAIRLALGGLFLIIIILIRGQFTFKNWPINVTILAAFFMALYQPLFFSAVSITGVAIGTLVAIGSAPIFSILIEGIYLKIYPSKTWWISTFLAIVGCFILFSDKESVYVNYLGIIMALGAGLSFASYTFISRSLVEKHSSLSVLAIVFTLSAIFLSPFLFIFDLSWMTSFRGIGVSLQLGIVATGIAYFLFSKGLVHVSSSTAVTLSLVEPLTAAALGVFVVGEYLSIISWVGVAFLMLGIGILIWTSARTLS